MIFRFIVSIQNYFGVRCSRRNLFVIYVCKNPPQKKKHIRTILRGNHCITATYDEIYLFIYILFNKVSGSYHIAYDSNITSEQYSQISND